MFRSMNGDKIDVKIKPLMLKSFRKFNINGNIY